MLDMIKLHSTARSATVLRVDLLVEQTGMAGDTTLGVVLCRTPESIQPYVTWRVMIDEEGVAFHASSGNYFNTYEEACADYNQRRGVHSTGICGMRLHDNTGDSHRVYVCTKHPDHVRWGDEEHYDGVIDAPAGQWVLLPQV